MSTLWVWGVRSDVEGGQPQGVKHPHVAGAVLDRHGVVGGGLIQQGQRRMGLFRQLVVVIACLLYTSLKQREFKKRIRRA